MVDFEPSFCIAGTAFVVITVGATPLRDGWTWVVGCLRVLLTELAQTRGTDLGVERNERYPTARIRETRNILVENQP
jgi:hypothetical protein